jgi:hypothetical protein
MIHRYSQYTCHSYLQCKSDNNLADGGIKLHDIESVEVGLRRSVDLTFILHLRTLIVAQPVAQND